MSDRPPDTETETEETGGSAGVARLRPLAMLGPLILRYRGHLAAALLALVAAAAATLAVPLAVRQMIDHGFSADQPGAIDRYFILFIGLVAVLAAASALRFYFVTWLGERVVADLRRNVFAHLTDLGIDFFDRVRAGEIVSRLTADTSQIKATAGANISIALRNLVLFIGAVAMMVVTSPRLSTLVVVAIPVVVLPLIGFGRQVRRRSRFAQDTLASASAYAAEAIGAIRTLKVYTQEEPARQRFAAAVEAAFVAARASTVARAALTAVAIFLVFASMVAVLWYGAQDVLAGEMTPGTLGQFLFYAVLAAGAFGELSQIWGDIALAAGAAERLTELLAEEPSIRPPATPLALPTPAAGSVRFDDVRFAYRNGGNPVIDAVSFAVEPGETVAIVGPSGAGKTTLFSLLVRFYDPDSGQILIDGVDIADADPVAIRRHIAFVQQDPAIFAASVAENIGLGRPGADPAAVRAAAAAANADGFIGELPDGYDSVLGERGVTLSGGQRQRIAIARAILKDAPILLLDEATSALDSESEGQVRTALNRLMTNRTTLVIAHRLATILEADRILVIDRGRLVEQGDHATLVAAGGLYARLARMQFEEGRDAIDAIDTASDPIEPVSAR